MPILKFLVIACALTATAAFVWHRQQRSNPPKPVPAANHEVEVTKSEENPILFNSSKSIDSILLKKDLVQRPDPANPSDKPTPPDQSSPESPSSPSLFNSSKSGRIFKPMDLPAIKIESKPKPEPKP